MWVSGRGDYNWHMDKRNEMCNFGESQISYWNDHIGGFIGDA